LQREAEVENGVADRRAGGGVGRLLPARPIILLIEKIDAGDDLMAQGGGIEKWDCARHVLGAPRVLLESLVGAAEGGVRITTAQENISAANRAGDTRARESSCRAARNGRREIARIESEPAIVEEGQPAASFVRQVRGDHVDFGVVVV